MKNICRKEWWKRYAWEICYTLVVMILGTILHFTYEWSGKSAFAALFSAVNESVWEHLKIFFVPAFFFSLFMYYKMGDEYPNYLWCQTKSILAGIFFIVATYFIVYGITKREIVWVDIAIFYFAAILAGMVSAKCRRKVDEEPGEESGMGRYAGVILLLLWALFIGLTYYQPAFLIEWLPGLFSM